MVSTEPKWLRLGFQIPHDPVIGVAEAVDRLLGVADEKEAPAFSQGFLDERFEVPPLDGRGVLEFVDQIMIDAVPEPEIDVGHDPFVDVAEQLLVDVFDKEDALPALDRVQGRLQGAVGAEIRQEEIPGIQPGEFPNDDLRERSTGRRFSRSHRRPLPWPIWPP